jgi:uncharacterized RDD family membrane protein YckC
MAQNWYYASNQQQLGPVSEEELDRLATSGAIGRDTLVWRDGMGGWEAYSAARGVHVAAGGQGFCSQCGAAQPFTEMVRFGDAWVCANCKENFAQRLRETGLTSPKFHYAGFWIRVLAKIIDSVLLITIYLPISYLTSPIILRTASSGNFTPTFLLLEGLLFGVQILGSATYDSFFVWRYGATPGKMICGKKVVTVDGKKLTLPRAIARHFANYLSSFTFGIGYLMIAFDEEKRALHDRICDTRVVDKQDGPPL